MHASMPQGMPMPMIMPMFVPWNPYMNMNMGMPGMGMPGMSMGGMGMGGMGGMGMGGMGMAGTSASASAGVGTAGQRAPRTAWGPEEGSGAVEEGGAPDAFALLDENFRAQLLSLRLAASRHRKALQ